MGNVLLEAARHLRRVVLSLALGGIAFGANAYDNGSLWVGWNWPGNSFYNVDQIFQIPQLAPDTFWSMYWFWSGSPHPVDEPGYLGVQTNHDVNGNYSATANIAIFSVWNANGASGRNCLQFGGEGTGWSCRVPLSAVHADNNYRLRLWRLGADEQGVWWGAWIFDSAAGQDIFIGQIRVNPAYQYVSNVWNFTEAIGQDCNRSVVHWTDPAANFNAGRYEFYSAYSGQPSLGVCPADASAADWGWTRGVQADMGR